MLIGSSFPIVVANIEESRPLNPFTETCVRVLTTPVRRYNMAKADCENNGQYMIELRSRQIAEWFRVLHTRCKGCQYKIH